MSPERKPGRLVRPVERVAAPGEVCPPRARGRPGTRRRGRV